MGKGSGQAVEEVLGIALGAVDKGDLEAAQKGRGVDAPALPDSQNPQHFRLRKRMQGGTKRASKNGVMSVNVRRREGHGSRRRGKTSGLGARAGPRRSESGRERGTTGQGVGVEWAGQGAHLEEVGLDAALDGAIAVVQALEDDGQRLLKQGPARSQRGAKGTEER